MFKLGVILLASDQDKIIKDVVKHIQFLTDEIYVIYDNPTNIVWSSIKNLKYIYEYNTKECLVFDMMGLLYFLNKFIKKTNWNCKWILRSDGDEIWDRSILGVLDQAEILNKNVIDVRMRLHHPLLKTWNRDGDIFKVTTTLGVGYYNHPIDLPYERIWSSSIIDPFFQLSKSGHEIICKEKRVFKSKFHFDHFYALDFAELERKKKRVRSPKDSLCAGANSQYKISLFKGKV